MTVEERRSFSQLLKDADLVDAFRQKHPDASGVFRTYSQRVVQNRPMNRGLRLDYVLASPSLKLADAFILSTDDAWPFADHRRSGRCSSSTKGLFFLGGVDVEKCYAGVTTGALAECGPLSSEPFPIGAGARRRTRAARSLRIFERRHASRRSSGVAPSSGGLADLILSVCVIIAEARRAMGIVFCVTMLRFLASVDSASGIGLMSAVLGTLFIPACHNSTMSPRVVFDAMLSAPTRSDASSPRRRRPQRRSRSRSGSCGSGFVARRVQVVDRVTCPEAGRAREAGKTFRSSNYPSPARQTPRREGWHS